MYTLCNECHKAYNYKGSLDIWSKTKSNVKVKLKFRKSSLETNFFFAQFKVECKF